MDPTQAREFLTGRSIVSGDKDVTTAGTPEVLAASQAVRGVVVRAKSGNTDVIYVGPESTPTFPIAADEAIELRVDDVAAVWIDAAVNGEGVHYVAEVD